MYTYSAQKIPHIGSQELKAESIEKFVQVLKGTDWTEIMGAWIETHETPLPAYILKNSRGCAALHISGVFYEDQNYYQLHYIRNQKKLWFFRKRTVIAAEIHELESIGRYINAFWQSDFDILEESIRKNGRNFFGDEGDGPGPSAEFDVSDADVIDGLRAAGSDLSRLHDVDFYLYFTTEESAERVADVLSSRGFEASARQVDHASKWVVHAQKQVVPTQATMASIGKELRGLAAVEQGEYDGWGAGVIR